MDTSPELANLLRTRKNAILDRWSSMVRDLALVARRLPQPVLFDSMPLMLDDLAEAVETGHAPAAARRAPEHAQQRLEIGYEVGQLVAEYSAFRKAIYLALEDVMNDIPASAFYTLSCHIDVSVNEVMERFNRARQQKLHAFERITEEPLRAKNLEELLARLLEVMAEVAPEVDTVTILLREGDTLRVRASRGLEEELNRSFHIAVGQGFAGTIAQTRKPMLLEDASTDPIVKSDAIRKRGVRALYGVPLIDVHGDLVGVAHVGSTRAYDLQEEDLILFRGLANRATALIASRRATDQLLEDEQQRERFIGVLGHDLRSPLNAILGSARMLLTATNLDERERAVVARIVRSGDRMARLVGDLFDFTRTRLGEGISLHKGWVDLNELMRDVADEQRAAHPGRRVDVVGQLPFRVCCDHDRMLQVVSNIVANALMHGDREAPVTVRLEARGDDARITIHNEGRPIPDTLLPHIFDPFRRGGDVGAAGIGLGLYIARAIVTAHGGSVEARSGKDEGTTFIVQLSKNGTRS